MTANKKLLIITGAGLAVGLAEALLYYNLGTNSDPKKDFQFGIPKGAELGKTLGIVLAMSVATALLSNGLEFLLNKQELQIA